jgi:hypothetical protein
MRAILVLSVFITLCGSANAATAHHAHRRHAVVHSHHGMFAREPASGFAYARPRPPIYARPAPYNYFNEPYFGASQGYAPGEKERFLESVLNPY